jgi:flagellar FliJ protein
MARFKFRLEGVLRHRKHLEQQQQRELAMVQGQMARLQGQLRELNDSVKAATDDVRQNHMTGKLDLDFLAGYRRFMVGMQRQAVVLMQKMALVQKQVEEAQKGLAEAAKQRKVIEKLKERQEQRWMEDVQRKENADLDEIGVQMSFLRMTGRQEASLMAENC